MNSKTADTVEEWIELYRMNRRIAEQLIDHPTDYVQAWSNAGFAIECLIKAAIMSQERLNSWPSRSHRKDLYVHSIKELLSAAGVSISPIDTAAPAWSIMFRWERTHTYVTQMPKAVAIDCLSAAFSDEGAAEWLFQNCLKNYA